jgi:hypothetical protein
MFKEKPISISENRILTNKGRIFEQFTDYQGLKFWTEIDLPNFNETKRDIPKGKTTFIEPVSQQEKWNNAKTIKDLTNE